MHAPQKFMPVVCRILVMKSLSSLAAAVTAGPRVEIYTELVCRGYTPARVETPALLSPPPVATTTPSVILSNAVSPTQAHFPHVEQAYTTVHTTDLYTTAAHPLGGCASHPYIQAEIAKLGAGVWFDHPCKRLHLLGRNSQSSQSLAASCRASPPAGGVG